MKLIPHWREWLSQRPDSEHWQALIRVGLVGATLLILSVAQWPSVEPQRLQLARWVLLGSLVFSLSLSALVALGPSASVPRRLLGMLHDVVMVSLALYLCEAVLAPYAAIYLIGSVGNGFRFGTKYLYLCTVLSAASFGLVYVFSDYWQAQATLSLSIAVMITAVPLYAGHLLSTLNRSKAQLRLQATEDSLTSFLNRAELGLRLTQLFYREPQGHAFLFCDLDHFKDVNDVAGHAAGDKLLVDVSCIIRNAVRGSDLCGRPGGDEFCVLLMNCDLKRARHIAEQICAKVADYRLAWGQQFFSVGISIGVAPTSAVTDAESLLRLADAACYAAKNAGRNRIHVVDPPSDAAETAQVRRLHLPDAGAADPARSAAGGSRYRRRDGSGGR